MLSFKTAPRSSDVKATPNVVPFRVGHNGEVDLSRRYWDPQSEAANDNGNDKDAKVAHFRGRRLVGKTVPLKEGYRGAVVKVTNEIAPPSHREHYRSDDAEDEDGEDSMPTEPTRLMEEVASFDEVVVWGHDSLPADDDPTVRSLEEWIGLAEAMNTYEETKSTG